MAWCRAGPRSRGSCRLGQPVGTGRLRWNWSKEVSLATSKRIVCLANSRKLQGRCVAGYEIVDGKPAGWIRPVSDRPHEEVSEYERQYADGSDPRVLDVIDVPLKKPRPQGYQ